MPLTPSRIPQSTRRSSMITAPNNNKIDENTLSTDNTSQQPPTKRSRPETKLTSNATRTEAPISQPLIQSMTLKSKSMSSTAPAWDARGKLEGVESMLLDMKEQMQTKFANTDIFQAQLVMAQRRIEELEREKILLEEQTKNSEKNQIDTDILEAKSKQIEKLVVEKQELEEELGKWKSRYHAAQNEIEAFRLAASRQTATVIDFESQICALKAEQGRLTMESSTLREENVKQANQLDKLRQHIIVIEQKLQAAEKVRRKLHNDVQELRGNIRVFCRIRPILGDEQLVPFEAIPSQTEPEQLVIQTFSEDIVSGQPSSKPIQFSFDRVFGMEADQLSAFEEISQLVQSALDGYRVCIFAYGQTGSGKTFTMEGGLEEKAGMIPRAVEQIFAHAHTLRRDRGWQFEFSVSYLEIYNEAIRDLLSQSEDPNATKQHEIRHQNGQTTITELQVIPVFEVSDVLTLLKQASKNRAVAETLCNDRSSRSHRIIGENFKTNEKIDGLLNLIDLAGSERLSVSGSTGDRLKETQAINKSLSALGDVIAAIASKEQHIPYRNSKLTFLLQNSLGGNCKTLMFVNVSPAQNSLQETLCSLRFASKVNSCHIGPARKNILRK